MFNDRAVYQAPGPVEIVKEFNDKVLIFYNTHDLYDTSLAAENTPLESEEEWEKISRNILMVDKKGEIVWRIENFNYKNKPDRYIWAAFENKEWYVYTKSGYLKTFDLNTGKILTSEYAP
jgi:hypothetical protein